MQRRRRPVQAHHGNVPTLVDAYAYGSFEPTADWQDITINAKDLTWSQAFTGDMETLPLKQALGSVIRLGFMKYDGTAQAFDLEVASIRFE